jgi:hypothetical protein
VQLGQAVSCAFVYDGPIVDKAVAKLDHSCQRWLDISEPLEPHWNEVVLIFGFGPSDAELHQAAQSACGLAHGLTAHCIEVKR